MEEKEYKFYFTREDENGIEITSNFDLDLNFLEADEGTVIILYVLRNILTKIWNDVSQQEECDELDKEKEIYEVNEMIADYIGTLFYDIINLIHDSGTEENKQFDYSLAIYGINEENQCKDIFETYHYGNLQVHEKLLACMAFYKDIVSELLKKNSKEQVKKTINQVFSVMHANLNNYIDKE